LYLFLLKLLPLHQIIGSHFLYKYFDELNTSALSQKSKISPW
jgi:hypothetical protein